MSNVYLATNPTCHARTKHVKLDLHFVRECVVSKQLSILHIPSDQQLVDLLIKPLSIQQFIFHRSKLNIMIMPLRLRRNIEDKLSSMSATGNQLQQSKDNDMEQ